MRTDRLPRVSASSRSRTLRIEREDSFVVDEVWGRDVPPLFDVAHGKLAGDDAGATSVLRRLYQWLAGGHDGEFVQLGGDAGAVGVGFGGGQTLAQLNNLFLAGTTPANLGPSAGCGHVVLLN